MSITETFLNEFCAVPGFKIEAKSSRSFIITDLSVENERDHRRTISVEIGKDNLDAGKEDIHISNYYTSVAKESLLKDYVNITIDQYFKMPDHQCTPSLTIVNLALKFGLSICNY